MKNIRKKQFYFYRTNYPVAKTVSPQILIDVMMRGLTIHKCIISDNQTLEVSQFSLFLLEHQIELCYLLRSTIAW